MESAIRNSARNEAIAGECLNIINLAPDAEEGLRRLLEHLGKALRCDRVYVFETIDRQHLRNTYEWCAPGVPSGVEQLPYLAKKDLNPWYEHLCSGGNIILPDVEALRESEPLIYGFLHPQGIRSIVLSPMLAQEELVGFLGADGPPPERMENISVLFNILAHFVCSLVSQRELARLREARAVIPKPPIAGQNDKIVLLVDDSSELLHTNERVLRAEGYGTLCAGSIREAWAVLENEEPDAIVLDLDLPDGSGVDFCREVRRRGLTVPLVCLSARSDAQTAQKSIAAGGCSFLTKPYGLEELHSAVAAAVEKK